MMLRNKLWSACLVFVVAAALCACGGSKLTAAGAPPVVAPVGLPAPSAILRQSTVADAARLRTGDSYLPAYTQHVTAGVAGTALFASTWGPGQMGADDPAYAVYLFPLDDYAGTPQVHSAWNTEPAAEQAWVGFSDFSRDTWEWFAFPAGGSLAFTPAKHQTGTGRLLVAVMVLDSTARQLNFLRVGDDLPPLADLSADITSGPAPLTVNFSAAASLDRDGGITKFEFDPLGDGSWVDNGTSPDYSYEYLDSGAYTARLRVTDTAANIAFATQAIGAGWQHSWGGADWEEGWSAAVDPDGNLHVLGLTTTFGQGANELLLLKYDPQGNVLWQKTFGKTSGDSPATIVVDGMGNIYIAASNLDSITSDNSPYVISLTPTGVLRWQDYFPLGGESEATGIALDGAGGLYVACQHPFAFPTEPLVLYFRLLTADGSVDWAYDWGGAGTDYVRALTVDENGNGYFLCTTTSFSVVGDEFSSAVVSFDSTGAILQSFIYGMDEALSPVGISVAGGKIYLLTDYQVACITTGGVLDWQYELVLSDYYEFSAVLGRPTGCYVLGAFTNPSFMDALFLDFSASGSLDLKRQFGAAGRSDSYYGVVRGPGTGLYLTGRSNDNTPVWAPKDCTTAVATYSITSIPDAAVAIPLAASVFTGVLADVPAGSEVIDTGGGAADAITSLYFP